MNGLLRFDVTLLNSLFDVYEIEESERETGKRMILLLIKKANEKRIARKREEEEKKEKQKEFEEFKREKMKTR